LGYSLSFASNKADHILNPIVTEFVTGCERDLCIVKTTASLRAKDIWNNYIKALGGVDNLMKVRDRTTIMESHINGQNIVIEIYQKVPDKMKQRLTTSSITQSIYFDGGKSVIEIDKKKSI
jgi:hypothetical protein